MVGKPNVGKSTFFNASTLSQVEAGNYPFTTVNANKAIGYVKVKDPGQELGVTPNPKNSAIIGEYRFVPVEMIDVAGLVPKAHEGRGLGNKFLDDLRQAKALIHVVDASGSTDAEGNPVKPGTHDPVEDVRFLEEEIELWYFNIFLNNWDKITRKLKLEGKEFAKNFAQAYSGLGIREGDIMRAVRKSGLDISGPEKWSKEEIFSFTKALRAASKPIIIAANKMDIDVAHQNVQRLKDEFPDDIIIPVSSMGEYLLRKLSQAGGIEYVPGEKDFKIADPSKISDKFKAGLTMIKEKVLDNFGSTGVQEAINRAVFEILEKIAVFPVEDEGKLCNKDGEILPDAFLLDKGATPRDLAFKIHTDIGNNFIGAIDARTKRKISSDKELNHMDIIKILTKA